MHDQSFDRRAFLQTALGMGAFFLLPRISFAQGGGAKAQPFSWDALTQMAQQLAASPYQPPEIADRDILEQVDYDFHNQIRFKPDSTLWKDVDGSSRVQMFFPGRYFKDPVRIFTVQDGMATEVPFDLDLFDIPADNPAQGLDQTRGFAGFRVQGPDGDRDWMAFLGASYWRTSGYSGQFGLSARGLAVDTAMPEGPEEFPIFTSFWLERGEGSDVTAYALMDSPSVTGAYRIASHQQDGAIQDVTARIFLRKDIRRLGLAPLTSMFWYGKNSRHLAPDWRPEVHDSDGLQILTAGGERIWRPLNNPPRTMANSFQAPSVQGFGLMQRERDFDEYQDDGVFYEKRASAWVEPQGDWGDGAVMLVELRTDDEIHDNIVALWRPAEDALAGSEHEFSYRLSWVEDVPIQAPSGRFIATRFGAGGVPGQPRPHDVVKLVCDFTAPGLTPQDDPALNVVTSDGNMFNQAVRPIVGTENWRATVDIDFAQMDPETDKPIDLRIYISTADRAVTETLLLQLFPSQLRKLLASRP
ncbi:glucan biosynthesis protein [Paracoccus fistulariae]|uniref:Glucan biosynthesis protein D n=2 Tax=Paracoccus fistulariae TaxID=658446 RepID=A0ABY7SGL2_9RHOB|nr:glucan biosynthesis protein D [Paracoccus fistulariae]WCR06149.1 glucan biosynthesis protein D [Paracoccus fistulariae]